MTQHNTDHAHTNHLIHENSPYLLSHAHNPVNWYPWGEEALARAKAENKPIFLSIGYAACHWCHVMERESFENETIAEVLNQYYIAIKVDREQRPDLDHIYMSFTQALTGRGGWPMSVFLTPDLKPFFAGTYFPPQDIQGHPGFMKVITEIARAWEETEEQITTSSEDIFAQISTVLSQSTPPTTLIPSMIDRGVENLMRQVDQIHGGIGTQPKFPHATEHSLFLRHYRKTGDLTYLQAAEKGLMGMARGGIYDQIGGGFARYSTDNRWLVPHFEKMLYDNGLLVPVYAEAYQITKNEYYRKTVIGTLDFILREMTDPKGGFYSALDADSEGEEGKFYVWSEAEIDSVLGDKAEPFKAYMNVTARGNFEGHNILNIDKNSDRVKEESSLEDFDKYIAECSALLMKARDQRVRPLTDDKILTSWNGLALSALARGYQITADHRYLDSAIKNAEFVRDVMYHNDSLTHSYREGNRSDGQFLEDYAFYIRGLIDLYESDPSDSNTQWLTFATTLASQAVALFMDDENRFYLRPEGQSDLILRPKDEQDGALPAPGSIMIGNLIRLSRLTGDKQLGETAHNALSALSGIIDQAPNAMSSALVALDHHINDKIEIVVVGSGEERDKMLATLYAHYIPGRVIAISPSGKNDLPLFEGRADSGEPKAYVCVNSVCALPAVSAEEFANQLQKL